MQVTNEPKTFTFGHDGVIGTRLVLLPFKKTKKKKQTPKKHLRKLD